MFTFSYLNRIHIATFLPFRAYNIDNQLIIDTPFGLTSITIPYSVTSLGNDCFHSCDALTSITIPSSVTSLGDYCFSYSGLTSITIPSSVTSLGKSCFEWCRGLTSITIPSSVTSLGSSCFYMCIYNHRTTKTNQKYPSVNL
ncbi:leucine-rich repeat domain-containing protein [Prevotella sp.]|uniref:leucine-rich repeat domain-containing protein n=1 Tax=Prevotella sp. TaxID=59823 RepID=UPI0040268BC4